MKQAHEFSAEIEELKRVVANLELQVSVATDLANTWARELGIKECKNPYSGLALRALIDSLWNETD